LTFNAKETSKGAMNTRLVPMYANAYSEMNPHPTRCTADGSCTAPAPAGRRDHHLGHHLW
jgi:hypothetical protein